jgi:hypothetical protein
VDPKLGQISVKPTMECFIEHKASGGIFPSARSSSWRKIFGMMFLEMPTFSFLSSN